MSDYLTEEEQVERIRKWWKEYGLSTVVGIVLAIVIVVGWRYYKRHEVQKAQQASLVYSTMMSSAMAGQGQAASLAGKQLIKSYSGTSYASIAALWLAKQAIDNKQYAAAIKQLKWVVSEANMKSFSQVARIRLAQVYVQQQKAKQALSVLSVVNDKAYAGLIAQAQGDAYVQLKDLAKARAAYQQALNELPKTSELQPILAMKLADLPS